MDFIEKWFHLAPDGGSGVLEALYVGLALCAAVAFALRSRIIRALRERLQTRRFLG